jgi:hypothetical protein
MMATKSYAASGQIYLWNCNIGIAQSSEKKCFLKNKLKTE